MAFYASAPSRVWRFGCRPPRENVEAIERQFSLAHRYYNNLIELERRRRQDIEAAVRDHSPTLLALEQSAETLAAELKELRDAIKRRNAASRRRTGDDTDRARVKDLEARRREAFAAARAERDRLWGRAAPKVTGQQKPKRRRGEPICVERVGGDRDFLDRIEAIENAALARSHALRGGCGVFWGTYLKCEAASDRATRDALPGLPSFRRWTGDGLIAVQLQDGLSVTDALIGTDTRLRLVMQEGHRSARGQNGVAWLRIGSEGRAPVWAKFAFRLHRPLPAGAVIKWATISRRRVGTFTRYWLNITLADEDGFEKDDLAAGGRVAVNVGWRWLADGGLRVATWVGDDGMQGVLLLSPADLARWTKADELRSIRDKNFDEVRGRLAAWLADNAAIVPDWLRDACTHLHQWRSPGRLAVLIGVGEPRAPREGEGPRPRWRESRFDGDEEMFALLDGWLKQDRHLLDWEANHRRKAVAWREWTYQNFAAALRRQYRELRIAKVDYRRLARRAEAEDEDEPARLARWHRTVASPGRIGELLRDGMAEEVVIAAPGLTTRCHVCGCEEPWDQAAEVVHRCAGCGNTWDQDYNHCKNLLAWEPGDASGEAVNKEPGFARGPKGESGSGDMDGGVGGDEEATDGQGDRSRDDRESA